MGEPAVAAAVDDAADRQTVLLVDDNATNLQVLYLRSGNWVHGC